MVTEDRMLLNYLTLLFLLNYLAESPATWKHRCWCFSSLPLWHPVGSPANCVLSRTGNTTVSPPISGEMAGACPVGAYPVGKGVGGGGRTMLVEVSRLVMYYLVQCCGSGMFIPNPGSNFSILDPRSRIRSQKDSGSRSASKSLSIFNPKIFF